ncbi:MAG: GNAT family N-acetyltransferase [Tuberibacillus sp.]
MEIRRLDPQYADQCLKLRLEALKTHPEAFSSSYEEEIQSPVNKYEERLRSQTSFTIGALENDQLIGMVGLVIDTYKKLQHKAEIVSMYVTPEQRRSGIGRALLSEAIKMAKEMEGIEQVRLTVNASNIPAKRLYASLGFQSFGTELRSLKVENTYYDEEYMVLFL